MNPLPHALVATPSLDRWIRVTSEGRVIAFTGKVEIGQGILTALGTVVAEELDVARRRVQVVSAHTGRTPNEGVTAGSMSIETSGAALRQASAWARRLLLRRAAARLSLAEDDLTVADGEISGPGVNERLTYWDLAGQPFDFEIRERTPEKAPSAYRLVGREGHRRTDIFTKATAPAFVHDAVPDLHARVVRPPSLHHRLTALEVEVDSPGRLIVDGSFVGGGAPPPRVDGSFVAVAHPREFEAERLAERVAGKARWRRATTTPARLEIDAARRESAEAFPLRDGVPSRSPRTQIPTTHRGSYSRPFLMHASLGPSAATAVWRDGAVMVESASQGVEPPGHRVLLKWSREDEHGFEPLGPAMHVEMGATLDEAGGIAAWTHDVYGFTHVARPSPRAQGVDLLAARLLAKPFDPTSARPALGPEVGIHRNALPIYAFPNQEVTKHFIPHAPVRTSALRGLGAQGNVFAIESFMDELALAAGTDPADFRRRHLGHDSRALAVLNAVLEASGGLAGNRGLGLARYKNRQCCAAVVAEASVDPETAEIRVPRLWIAADAGRVIDPDGLINQLEGGAVQALSWCLKEAVTFDAEGAVTSRDWSSYPILRFSEVPEIETVLLDHPDLDPLGAGEATVGPTSGALANAVFAASGLRIRDLPMTPDRLRDVAAR